VFEILVALEFARADAEESDAIAVFGVEVGVYFENKAREFGFVGFYFAFGGGSWQRVGGYFDERVEQFLYAEAIEC